MCTLCESHDILSDFLWGENAQKCIHLSLLASRHLTNDLLNLCRSTLGGGEWCCCWSLWLQCQQSCVGHLHIVR